MTVPSVDVFDRWLSRADTPLLPPLADNVWDDRVDVAAAAERLYDAGCAWEAGKAELFSMSPYVWLHAQPAFQRGCQFVDGRDYKNARLAPGQLISEWAQETAASLARRAASISESERGRTFRVLVNSISTRSFREGWPTHFVRALREYHYGDTVAQMLAARGLATAARRAEEALAEYLSHIDAIAGFELAGTVMPPSNVLRRAVREGLVREPEIALPIKRNDQRNRERLLVYRLWAAHRRVTLARQGKPSAKAAAITEFLWLEGIEHRYDARTVERLCAEFTDNLGAKRR